MTAPAPNPPNKVGLGRRGCLPATLAATPFLLAALVCVVLAIMAFNEPVYHHPVGPPTTPVSPHTVTSRPAGTTEPTNGSDR